MADEKDPFEDIKKEMQTRFELLPEEIQKVITGSEYQMKLFEIAKKNKLTYEQLGTVEMETTMVLLGMTKPDDFRDEIQVELKLNDPEIEVLVKDISEIVFVPVREALKQVYEKKAVAEAPRGTETKPADNGTQILAKAGISIENDTETKTPANIESRLDAMSAIENPVKSEAMVLNPIKQTPAPTIPVPPAPSAMKNMPTPPAPNSGSIVADKLGGIVGTPKKETTYTPAPPNNLPQKSNDPYKEPL